MSAMLWICTPVTRHVISPFGDSCNMFSNDDASRAQKLPLSNSSGNLPEHFTDLKPQNQEIAEVYVFQNCRFFFEAPRLGYVRSGITKSLTELRMIWSKKCYEKYRLWILLHCSILYIFVIVSFRRFLSPSDMSTTSSSHTASNTNTPQHHQHHSYQPQHSSLMMTSTPQHNVSSMLNGVGGSSSLHNSPMRFIREDSVDGTLSPVSSKSAGTDTDMEVKKKVSGRMSYFPCRVFFGNKMLWNAISRKRITAKPWNQFNLR